MKRRVSLFLIVILSLGLIVTPVLAKGGGGNTGGNGGGNGNGKSSEQASSQTVSSEKSNNAKLSSTNTNAQSKQGSIKQSKILKGIDTQQVKRVKEKIAQKISTTTQKNFKDTNQHWAQKNISKVQRLGLINGYQDGSFQPNNPVTCAEAMVMTVNLAETLGTDQLIGEEAGTAATQDTTGIDSSDVPEWAENQAKIASELGIINLNRFHSSVQASRVQTAVMLAKALNLDPINQSGNSFSDSVLISAEDLGYILALKDAGIIFGSSDGKFNPNSRVTRAEIAAMLDRAVEDVQNDGEVTEPVVGSTEPGTGTTGTTSTSTTTETSTDNTGTTGTIDTNTTATDTPTDTTSTTTAGTSSGTSGTTSVSAGAQ